MKKIWLFVAITLLVPAIAQAENVTFSWSASPSADVAGYRLYLKSIETPAAYIKLGSDIVGKATLQATVPITIEGAKTYRVVATAYDLKGNESTWSNEATRNSIPEDFTDVTPPAPPGVLSVLNRIADALGRIATVLEK